MPRTKKSLEEKIEEALTPEPISTINEISPLDLDFGRADLNALRDKLNEVISKGNK